MRAATGTVHEFRRPEAQSGIGEEYSFADIYELCAFMQGEIVRSKLKYSVIAAKAGCCPQTVSRMASGETHQPRASTAMMILGVLGFQWVARR